MILILRYLLIFLAGCFVLTGCIPNKRLVYLQNEVEPKRGEVANADSIARSYTTEFAEYVLKPRDIISLRVASITPSEFDFVQKYEEQLGIIRKLNQYDQSNQTGNQQRIGGSAIQGGDGTGLSSIVLDRQQTGFILDENGDLELPYLGNVHLEGLTIPETEELIKKKLAGYFETPVVRVQLLNFHFTILGEVNKEGRYTTFDPNANIIDAITLSGNLNDFADRSKIKIVRTEGGQAQVFYVNTLKEDLLSQPGFFLRPNDIIIVPPLQARATRKYTLPNYTTAISLVTSTLTFIFLLISVNK